MTIEPLRRHWFEPNGEGCVGQARVFGDLVRSRDAMAGRADRQAWPSAGLHRHRDPDLPDVEGALRAATAANDRDGGKFARPCRAGLAGAGLQHPLPPSEDPDGPHSLPPQHRCPAPADRQHGCEGRRRWRVVCQETRAVQAARLAQGSPRVEEGQKTVQWTVFPTTMPGRWKSGPSRSPAAGLAMPPCCPNCWTRSLTISPSVSSPQMAPTTPVPVTPPSRRVGRRPSYHPARTASHGRNSLQGRQRATTPCAVAAALAGPSGSAGPATTDEVWPKPRCAASSSWASASCLATSTDRSQSFRSGQRS